MKNARFALPLLFIGATHACEMMQYQRVQAAPGVHVFQAAEGTTAVVNANITAIVGSDAVMVVDTGQFPRIARRVITDIRRITPLPVRYVVNTHWHGDHLLANAAFKEAFPEARFIAHSHSIREGARYYTDYAAQARTRLPVVVDDMKKRREASTDDEEKLWLTKTLECVDEVLPQVEETTYLPPDQPMDGELKLDLGGMPVVVKHIGSGNTPGDLVVWVERARLVATGDIIVAPVPYAIGSNIEPWLATLGELRRMNAAIVVPGHGPVMRDDAYVRDVEALLASTRTQLLALQARGVSRADAVTRLDTAPFRDKYLTTAMRRQAFDQFFVKAAIAAIWPKT